MEWYTWSISRACAKVTGEYDYMNDEVLRAFVLWYKERHPSRSVSVFETAMCGYFHTYTKKAVELRKECCLLGLVETRKGGTFEITV